MSFLLSVADFLDRWIRRIGNGFAWFAVLLVAAIIIQVVLRYLFRSGSVKLEELQWHFYGVMIMISLSYAQLHNTHVRVDLLHHKFSPRAKAIVEILGILFLVIPFLIIVFLHSLDFFYDSWSHNESSDAPIGLPMRWIIKSFIPIGLVLWFFSVISRLIRELPHLVKHGSK